MIAILLASAFAYELRAGVTPVEKVLTMMSDMKAKGQQEMQNEADLFGEYKTWCAETSNTKEDAIREANAMISKLKAQIQKADSEAARLTDEVATLDSEIAQMQADKKSSTEIREKEAADFDAVNTDYTESVDSMGAALQTLSGVEANKANSAFMQGTFKSLPAKARAVIGAFMEDQDDSAPSGAPSGNAYSSSVGSVIEMVTDLKNKMTEERAAVRKDESNAKHAYSMLQQQLQMSIESSTDERDTKSERKAQRVAQSASDSGDLEDTTATRNEDEKYLTELLAQCSQKSSDFDARAQLRTEELEALQKAIDIIADGAVSGASRKHLPQLMQANAFPMLRASSTDAKRAQVVAFLEERAHSAKSHVLLQAAAKVQQGAPFDKIMQMIKDMIAKLTEEAAEEAEHKGWCDAELNTNKNTRDAKTQAVDQLMALSDSLSAHIQKLAEEMTDLTKAIAEIDAAVAAATEQRRKEKEENTVAVADAKAAQVAVSQAISVLKEFYAKAATATSFAQGPGDDAPASFDTPYKGMGGSSTGVMGMLDVILSDFVRLDEETSSEEAAAQRAFDAFSAESSADRAAKAGSLDTKTKTKTTKEKDLNTCHEDLKRTQNELDSAMEYYAELKTACIDAAVSYEERVARREEEIESLKEALTSLSD